MNPLRPQLSGLVFKLALFYVLLSLPCLMLVESGILVFEFNRFMTGVDNGTLAQATRQAADDLGRIWPSPGAARSRELSLWTQSLVLRLQRPHGGLLENDSYILVELSDNPIAAAVLAADGSVLARAPTRADWRPQLPHADSPELRRAGSDAAIAQADLADNPYRVRRAIVPVRDAGGDLLGYLLVELRLPVPWHRFLLDLSLEWPIVLGYLILFGIASSFFLATWVTRRLNRVARAAAAWSRGDFSDRIGDASRDELGRLSSLLDAMALELKTLMRTRTQLATIAERQRLARDLHDTVKQKAFALNLQLATVRRQLGSHAAAEKLAQAERLSQQIQHELVEILDELRATDTDLPFLSRLRERAREWQRISGIALDLDLDALPALNPADEDTLLRIADEALANVLRHSEATRAAISLKREMDTALLSIVDNGRGADDDARPGMGLRNMRERAASLPHGQFEFVSGADDGTRIGIRFFLPGSINP